MITDSRLLLADSAASGNALGVLIGSVIDLQAVGSATGINVGTNTAQARDIGAGTPVYLTIQAMETYTSTSNSDHISFDLYTSDTTGITDGTKLLSTSVQTYGNGTNSPTIAGGLIFQGTLPAGITYKRYLGIVENVTGVTTTGKISAFLSLDPNYSRTYTQAHVNFP